MTCAPKNINVKRGPVHSQTGGLRVHTAGDALHARVKKQARGRRLAKNDVFQIWRVLLQQRRLVKLKAKDKRRQYICCVHTNCTSSRAPDIPTDRGNACSEISTLPVCRWPLMEGTPAARSSLRASRIWRPNFEMLGACMGSAWSYMQKELVTSRKL